MTHFNLFFKSLYNSIYIRIFIGFISWFINVKILKKLKYISSDESVSGTITHNISVLRKFPLTDFTMQRMERLLCSVKAIETVIEESEILMIGPRTESDIFKLFGLFPKSKITGVDLISYSKHIQLGDAHELEFNDNKFDVTISGWVISYTKTPMKMISEMVIKEAIKKSKYLNTNNNPKFESKLNPKSIFFVLSPLSLTNSILIR